MFRDHQFLLVRCVPRSTASQIVRAGAPWWFVNTIVFGNDTCLGLNNRSYQSGIDTFAR